MNGLQHNSAFVVQFRRNADPACHLLGGRVEHVSSGQTAIFQSVDDLPAIFKRMLSDGQTKSEPAPDFDAR